MQPYQIEANEAFFRSIITLTQEGGSYGWPSIREVFTVSGGKLHGTAVGLRAAKKIVSEDFYKQYFTLKK